MPSSYPYYQEPNHDQGAAITLTATNAGRTTATSVTEQRLIVDAVDRIFLLEPRLVGLHNSNIMVKQENKKVFGHMLETLDKISKICYNIYRDLIINYQRVIMLI